MAVFLFLQNCALIRSKKIIRHVNEQCIADLNIDFFPESFVVSPDVRKVAFVEKDYDLCVVVNDEQKGCYDNIGIGTPIFSPTGEYVAYFALTEGSSGGLFGLFSSEPYWTVVTDTIESLHYESLLDNSLVISPDGKHVAYATDDGYFYTVILDNERISLLAATSEDDTTLYWYDDVSVPFVFSPDSKHFAFVPTIDGKWTVVLDKKMDKLYDYILSGTPVFSPDSKKIAYGAVKGDDYFIVVDGKEGNNIYEDIAGETVTFSPDSKHLAFAAKKNGRWFIEKDGEIGKDYDEIGSSVIFSPDSKHLAYTAHKGDEWVVILDEKEVARYTNLVEQSLTFSPDSKRLAFGAKKEDSFVVVIDGEESKIYETIVTTPVFSPDSKHIAYTVQTGKKQYVILDDIEGTRYPAVISHNGGKIVFDSNRSFHYIVAKDDNKIYLIEEFF